MTFLSTPQLIITAEGARIFKKLNVLKNNINI